MNPLFAMIIPFFAGWLLDFLLGEPVWTPHPARLVDAFVRRLEPVLIGAFPHTPKGELLAGNLLTLLVPLISLLVAAILLALAWLIHPGVWMTFEMVLCYNLIGTRKLRDESMRVCKLLEDKDEHGDLSRARLALSRIVMWDTGKLDRQEITKATVEAVAENTVNCVVAPMFFLALGGGTLGIFHMSVNILGSIARYDNEKYRYFGTSSLKLYDVCGFIPARLAAGLMMLSTLIAGFDYKNAVRVFGRDRSNHEWPNDAQTISVCAGALGISLGGRGRYDGVYNVRQIIGYNGRPAETGDIRGANRLLWITSLLCVLLLSFLKLIVLNIVI